MQLRVPSFFEGPILGNAAWASEQFGELDKLYDFSTPHLLFLLGEIFDDALEGRNPVTSVKDGTATGSCAFK